jgi:NAD(P)-dependent dehydrogenase (short-subunit alcohol dehydrogenase family)
MSFPYRHVWIIGASTGLGAALAPMLAEAGSRVAVSARSADKLAEVAGNENVAAYPLDVTDAAAVAETHRRIEADRGPVDLVVFSAGIYRPMGADDFDLERFRAHVDTNLGGAANALAAVLPPMLARGAGKIALVASVAGYRGLPLAVAYGPTKAALNNLAEALRFDLEPKGLRIQVINPGFVETPLTAQNRFRMPHLMPLDKAARKLMKGLASERRFEVTFPWQFTFQLKLLRILPRPLYFWIVKRTTKR